MGNIKYDQAVLQRVVNDLYGQAARIVAVSVVLGLLIGAGGGYFSMLKERELVNVGAGIGAVLGILLGYAVGQSRAFALKVQAQGFLLQMQIERNTHLTAMRQQEELVQQAAEK
jgi:hypothetical protein